VVQQRDYKFVTYPGAAHPFFNDTGSRITQHPPKRPVWKP